MSFLISISRDRDRCLIGIVKNLRFSGFILYPLSIFIYSPFKCFNLKTYSHLLTGKKNRILTDQTQIFVQKRLNLIDNLGLFINPKNSTTEEGIYALKLGVELVLDRLTTFRYSLNPSSKITYINYRIFSKEEKYEK